MYAHRKFQPNTGPSGNKGQNCTDLNKTFPTDFSNKQCNGLKQANGVKDLVSTATRNL